MTARFEGQWPQFIYFELPPLKSKILPSKLPFHPSSHLLFHLTYNAIGHGGDSSPIHHRLIIASRIVINNSTPDGNIMLLIKGAIALNRRLVIVSYYDPFKRPFF